MENLTLESIKERIKENIKVVKISRQSERDSYQRFPEQFPQKEFKSSLNSKIIAIGLNNRSKIKRIPFLYPIARKVYHRFMLSVQENIKSNTVGSSTKRVINIEALMHYDHEEFIRELYRNILHREPGPEDFNYYFNLLLDCVPKEVVAYNVAMSREARIKDIRVEGLQKYKYIAKKYNVKLRLKRIPVISNLIVWLYRLIKLPQRFYELSRYFRILQLNLDDTNACFKQQSTTFQLELGKIKEQVFDLENTLDKRMEGNRIELMHEIQRLQQEMTSLNVAIDERIRKNHTELIQEIDRIRPSMPDWSEFYKEETNEEFLKANIEHHAEFIKKIEESANETCDKNIPTLVEIGVGTATMSVFFSKRFFSVVGIDNNPFIVQKAIETNKKLGGHAKFFVLDAFDLPDFFKPKLFDVAFSQGTFEHFANDELKNFIDAHLHVAKRVIFSVPSVNWPQVDFGNERRMTVEEWDKLLTGLGYSNIEVRYYKDDLHIRVVIK